VEPLSLSTEIRMTIYSPIQIVQLSGNGVNASSEAVTFTLTGVKIGDVLLSVDLTNAIDGEPVGANLTPAFRTIVVTDDTMQQNPGADLSDFEFTFTLLRFNQSA
jgi:hypothetical protein